MLDHANPSILIPNFTKKKGSILIISKVAKAASAIGVMQYPKMQTL